MNTNTILFVTPTRLITVNDVVAVCVSLMDTMFVYEAYDMLIDFALGLTPDASILQSSAVEQFILDEIAARTGR